MWAEPAETQNSAPPRSDPSTRLAASAVGESASSDGDVSHDASVQPPPCSFSSKALQTDEETPSQQAPDLMAEVQNLQRDKWLLEQQLQVWQLTVQSEQGILEERCSEMEVTMETLKEHNLRLQGMLTQALNKMEAQQQSVNTERENITPASDSQRHTDEDEEEVLLNAEDWSEEEQQTPSPTLNQDTPPSHDIRCEEEEEEEEPAGDRFLGHPIGQQYGPEEAGPQGENSCPSDEEENCGTCSPEEMLLEVVERLKSVMETDRWRERQTGERKRVELLQAAGQVGNSIHLLVDAVRTNTDAH